MESLNSLSSSYSPPFLLLSSSSLSRSKLHHSTPFPFAPKKSHNILIPPLKTLTPISSQLSSSIPLTHPDLSPSDEKFDWFSHWYPLSPICDLDKRAPHAKRVLGLDVVVWWDRNLGQWQVFDDRCPHRLAPLSEGRIDQWGRLQCVYHGWCFDGIGGCKYIPQADPDGPPVHTFKKAYAAVYPSFEQNKILWFWPNTDPNFKDIAAKHKPPHVPELDDPSYTCQIGTRDLHYGYDVLIENLMDPAHVPYAHHGLMRIPKHSGSLDREGGGPIDINIETSDVSGFISKQLFGYNKFIAPCLFLSLPYMSSSGGSVSSADTENNSSAKVNQKQRTVLLVFFCIPVSPGESRVIWAFGRNFAHWVDRIIPRWIVHVRNNLVFDSDLYLLHVELNQGRKIAEAGPHNWLKACFVPTKSDAQVIAFRTWFKKYSNDQVDWGNKFDGLLLPPTPPREQLMDRYWTHVVNCSSCNVAVKCLKALEVCLQVMSIASIGILAATKESLISSVKRSAIVSIALLFFLASRWLAHFIYRTFYYHDYNHAST